MTISRRLLVPFAASIVFVFAMTVAADGRVSANRPAERLEVSIVIGSTAADPMTLAPADTVSLKSSATNFP